MWPFKQKRAEVISHWYSLIPGFSMPVAEFYSLLETELKTREVPNLDITRVDFAEGGILSTDRTYLRMQRETLVFDVCAAPFGKSYFFSCRFAEIPVVVTIWHIIGLVITLAVLFAVAVKFFSFSGFIILSVSLYSAIYILRNAISMGLKDLDATLAKTPFIGAIYLRFFRRETYYRQDTRLMYCDTVNELTKEAVQTVTGAKGIEMIRFNEHCPLLEELYKRRFVKTVEPVRVKE